MALPTVLDEIDRLFDELVHRRWGAASRSLVPADIRDVPDGWVVELPIIEGLRAADLTLEVHGRRLIISGRRRSEARDPHSGWLHSKRDISLHRTITLPAEASPDDVEAKLEGTKLAIHIRKRRP